MVSLVQAATAKEAKANATLWSMNPFMGNLLLLYILKTTVPFLQSGMITSGDVTALLLYGTFSGGALAMIGNTYTTISKAAGAGTRLWTILDEKTPQIGGKRKLETVNGGITLRNWLFYFISFPHFAEMAEQSEAKSRRIFAEDQQGLKWRIGAKSTKRSFASKYPKFYLLREALLRTFCSISPF